MGQCVSILNFHRHNTVRNVKAYEVPNNFNNPLPICSPPPLQPKSYPFENDYTITGEVLGSGFSGKVLMICRKNDGARFALKRLLDREISHREIQLQKLASQNHRHIVRIVDVYSNTLISRQKYLFVVMEYMEGGALFHRIKQGNITEREAASIMHDITSAVAHLHSLGIAHRDIKPENILFTRDGVLKLADFGFAKQCTHEEERPLATACYTQYYVAPEILRHDRYDKSCDMWSLGVVMYFLLSGLVPFYSHGQEDFSFGMQKRIKKGSYTFPSPEWDNISEEAKSLVRRLLVTNPDARLTAEQMMKDVWIQRWSSAPESQLYTISNLNEKQLNEIQEMMKRELTGMRNANEIFVKPLHEAKSRILERRRQMYEKQNGTNEAVNIVKSTPTSTYDNVPYECDKAKKLLRYEICTMKER